jgi:hypothetical protein
MNTLNFFRLLNTIYRDDEPDIGLIERLRLLTLSAYSHTKGAVLYACVDWMKIFS